MKEDESELCDRKPKRTGWICALSSIERKIMFRGNVSSNRCRPWRCRYRLTNRSRCNGTYTAAKKYLFPIKSQPLDGLENARFGKSPPIAISLARSNFTVLRSGNNNARALRGGTVYIVLKYFPSHNHVPLFRDTVVYVSILDTLTRAYL